MEEMTDMITLKSRNKDNLIIAIRGNMVCTEDRKDSPTFLEGENLKKNVT